MSEFIDRQLVRLSDPALLVELVDPPGDTGHPRVRELLDAVYAMEFATVRGVSDVAVRHLEFQRPVFAPVRTSGRWGGSAPPYSSTDVALEQHDPSAPLWVDLAADLGLRLLLEVDDGKVESILTHEVTGFTTLNEFRSRFRFLDLDAFMAEHGITTVSELRAAFHCLITEIRLRMPPPFDPDDPANSRRYELKLAMLIRDTVDVAAALRDAKLVRTALERTVLDKTPADGTDEVEVRTPYALVVLFPAASLPGPPLTQAALVTLFRAEGMLALFI
ncbi:hypothetical protein ACFV9W_31475 [Streptomyces sp. NPDC059897]|uniref:hypothetical protein n=1 Tax=Streptomyces sp. NPDC059897 TaxID=3346994 RepID=UPI00364C28D3